MNQRKRLLIFWGAGFSVLLIDRVTKWQINCLPDFYRSDVIKGFFRIVKARNTGIAFSLFSGEPGQIKRMILIGISLLAVYILHVATIKLKNPAPVFVAALGLILGGAVGNLIDRILYGYVIDFLDFYLGNYHWPAFNIADSAITVGTAILLVGIASKKLDIT